MPIASCFFVGITRSLVYLPYILHHAFIHSDNNLESLLFSMLNSAISLSFPLYDRYSNPLIIFVVPCWTCSSKFMSVLYWWVCEWTQHSWCVSPVLSTGKRPAHLIIWQPKRILFWWRIWRNSKSKCFAWMDKFSHKNIQIKDVGWQRIKKRRASN